MRLLLFVLPALAYGLSHDLDDAVIWTPVLFVFVWLPVLIWFAKHYLNFLDELRALLRGEELPGFMARH